MSSSVLHLNIPILLPEVEDERDQCVARLEELVQKRKGIDHIHVEEDNGTATLCIHYDPNRVSLSQVQRWAEQSGARVTERYRHETLQITSMDCSDCSISVEDIAGRWKGLLSVAANLATEQLRVEYDTTLIGRSEIVRRLAALGYTVREEERPERWLRENWQLMLSVASGVLLGVGFLGETLGILPWALVIGLYAASYVAGGFNTARHGVQAALNLRFDIDFLMIVAAAGAAVLGEWEEGALLLFLFSLGHALEHYATDRARAAIAALGKLAPKSALVRRGGNELSVPIGQVRRDDIVIVRPGERIPVDGRVVEGRSAVDQSPITGESVPVDKSPKDPVFAGTVNGEGVLDLEVTRLAADSTLARVMTMVEEAQLQKSPTQRFTDGFERYFVPTVLAGTVLLILLPPLFGWLPFKVAFLRGLTILVAASPCALAIATPSAVLSAIARAARNGVLVKGGLHLENLGRLAAIAFDKTGTITVGRPEVVALRGYNGINETELLAMATAVEARSSHPLAQAVVREAQRRGVQWRQAEEVQSVTGRGIRSRLDGREILIGAPRFFDYEKIQVPGELQAQVEQTETQGQSVALVYADGGDGRPAGGFLGIIGFADQPRPEAAPALRALRDLGIRHTIMLTGDNAQVAASIARQVGLTAVKAELLPEDKVAAIKALEKEYGAVAMVGDGVNDAPALAQATVGITLGGAGTDVALETADVALMSDDLSKLPFAVGLSRSARRVILQNVLISLGVVVGLVIGALFGIVGIGPAIIFHEGSTLLVVANALRLLTYRR